MYIDILYIILHLIPLHRSPVLLDPGMYIMIPLNIIGVHMFPFAILRHRRLEWG